MIGLNTSIDEFICRALRDEPAPWSAQTPIADSDVFLLRCQHQGVTSLLFHCMREREEWPGWPAELRTAMEEVSKGQVAQELLRAHYLRRLLKGFSKAKIPCLLTKGEALANTLYPIPGTRTRADSDLFIAIEDIGKARRAVIDNGFKIESPIYKSHQFVVRYEGESAVSFEIDVHWRILNSPRYARTLSFDAAFARSVEVPGTKDVRTLNPEDSLLLACMHLAGSNWHDRDRLIWVYDIHLLVASMSPEQLAAFAEKAARCQVQDACLAGLNKSQKCLATVVPTPGLLDSASAKTAYTLAIRYRESNLALLLNDWKQLPDIHSRVSLIRELFLPDGEALLCKYGKQDRWWLPLLYLRNFFGGLTNRLMLK